MPSSDPRVSTGAEVSVRGERWTVLCSTSYEDCTALWLAGSDRSNGAIQRTLLLPFDTLDQCPAAPAIQVASRRRWWRHVHWHIRQQQPFGGLDALIEARIDLHPYQLEPALALHRHGCLRTLIADEVGLGKTIQAAAALVQLSHDEPDVRALIVCPAGLREQWRTELRTRFGLDATTCDPSWLLGASHELPAGVNPWSLPGVFVSSIDLVKRPEVLRALEEVAWDLAIFDEAHTLAPGTARLAAARALADRSRRVLLLTATPPDGDAEHFSALVSLGQQRGGDPALVFRRTREDVGVGRPRRSCLLPVSLSADESLMHRLLAEYTALLWREAGGHAEASGALLSILLRKRALSSAHALQLSLARRLVLLGNDPPAPTQIVLPLFDEDAVDDAAGDALVGARGLADAGRERPLLAGLLVAAQRAAADESKLRLLLRFLERAGEPAIVFTEYRDTLARLVQALPRSAGLQLHGAMLPHEREDVQARFARDGGVLLATDAASEGLNLHQRCRLIVHFELPWNPMRLEQRVGRVDRLGQRDRVHEVMLVARHTAERLVLAPLLRRTCAAHAHSGGTRADRLSESDIAAMILGGTPIAPPTVSPPAPGSTAYRGEAQAEAARLLHRRADGLTARTLRPEAALVVQGSTTDVLTIVVRAVGETAGGRRLGSFVLPVRVDLLHSCPLLSLLQSGDNAQTVLSALTPRLASAVRDHWSEGPPWEGWPRLLAALTRREQEIRSVLTSPARELVQASLFDRRAQAEADASRGASMAWQERADARLASLARQSDVQIRTAVIAVCAGELDGR